MKTLTVATLSLLLILCVSAQADVTGQDFAQLVDFRFCPRKCRGRRPFILFGKRKCNPNCLRSFRMRKLRQQWNVQSKY